ncbi:hypothetical protein GMSM_10040 [Geomonas sp. Red276]
MWEEGSSGFNNVYVSAVTESEQGVPVPIASIYGIPGTTDIAIDGNGNAVALWSEVVGSYCHTYACAYTVSEGWGAAVRLDGLTFSSLDPALAVDQAGNFYAAWAQAAGAGLSDIYCTVFRPASGWQSPQQVGTHGMARYPQLAAGPDGKVCCAWQQYDTDTAYRGDATVYGNYFNAAKGGWGTQQPLKTVIGSADAPAVSVDSSGNATVIWAQTMSSGSTSGYGIFSSRCN